MARAAVLAGGGVGGRRGRGADLHAGRGDEVLAGPVAGVGEGRSTGAKAFRTYPGSKDAGGSAERIIAAMPPHSVFVECCLGNGAVMRRKAPALRSIGIDADRAVIAAWARMKWPGLELVFADAIGWLTREGRELPADALVYADPPYLHSTRRKRKLYRCEMTDEQHERLLDALHALPCSVMVSGYASRMYSESLAGWRHESWEAMTRGGVMRTEHLWIRSSLASFNGAARYIGDGFRERERIKRLVERWETRYRAMPDAQRQAVLARLLEVERGKLALASTSAASSVPAASTRGAMEALR